VQAREFFCRRSVARLLTRSLLMAGRAAALRCSLWYGTSARAQGIPLTEITLISDLHLKERKDPPVLGTPQGMSQVYGGLSLPREIDADVLVIASNFHPDPEIRRQVLTKIEDELGIRATHVHGNHGYYVGSFPNDLGKLITIGRIQVVVATLCSVMACACFLVPEPPTTAAATSAP
jgi:hypothetical protein